MNEGKDWPSRDSAWIIHSDSPTFSTLSIHSSGLDPQIGIDRAIRQYPNSKRRRRTPPDGKIFVKICNFNKTVETEISMTEKSGNAGSSLFSTTHHDDAASLRACSLPLPHSSCQGGGFAY